MAETKDSAPKATRAKAAPKKETPVEARMSSTQHVTELGEDANAWVYAGEDDTPLVLSVGGTNYEFRKGSPVNLPPGQSPDHPDVHKVEE